MMAIRWPEIRGITARYTQPKTKINVIAIAITMGRGLLGPPSRGGQNAPRYETYSRACYAKAVAISPNVTSWMIFDPDGSRLSI